MKLTPSGSQTVGPFFRIGLEHLCSSGAKPVALCEIVTVRGSVVDGDGLPVPDALLEIWHADTQGKYANEFDESGRSVCFTRAVTDDEGRFEFRIPRPGEVDCGARLKQAPHLAVLVFARGLLRHLVTRMYFPGEAGNAGDSLLQMVPEDRRKTLIAREAGGDANVCEWDVVLQGPNETIFFAW
jgi:protocatechuate 3,4-dioxygenase alpha subunit